MRTSTDKWLPSGVVMYDAAIEILGEPDDAYKHSKVWRRRINKKYDLGYWVLEIFHCGIVCIYEFVPSGEGNSKYKTIISSIKPDEVKDICTLFKELKGD